jgi:hypothetical protein
MRGCVIALLTCVAVIRPSEAAPPVTLEPIPPEVPEELQPFEPSPRDLHWGRMLAEAALLFGIQEAVYWSAKEANSFDFEYELDWRNVRERFWTFEAWKLDDNYFNTNGWRHTGQGTLNYLFARSNGFSSVQSYVVSLALSATWELFGEHKEEVSFNDLLVTPRSGAVVGEAIWQLGVFFLRGRPTLFNEIAGNTLTLGRGLLDRWDGKPSFHSNHTNSLGFDKDVKHRFEVSVVGGSERNAGTGRGIVRFALDTELIMIPGFDRPGRGRQLRTAPSFTQIHVHVTRDEDSVTDFRARARAAVTAWNRKDIAPNGDGWTLVYGLSSAYEYGHHESNGRESKSTRDRVAVAHLLGPTVDLAVRRDAWRFRAVADVYANFGLLRNYAIDEHRARFPDDEVRSTIERDNYYHALGLTGRATLQLSYGPLAVGVLYQRDHFKSVQGLDRHQEDLVEDYPLYDQRGEGQTWLRYGLRPSADLSVELELSLELRTRSGRVKTTESDSQEERYLAGARFVF